MSSEADQPRSAADDVAVLEAWLAEPQPGDDVPARIGSLAEAYLEWFEQEGDADLLERSIGLFGEALAMAPGHDELAIWCFGLGVAHGYRAVLSWGDGRGTGDYDQAIHWLSRHRELLSRDDPRQDLAVMLLMDAIWDRFASAHDRWADDRQPAMKAALAVAHTIGALEVPDGEPAEYARLIRGLASAAAFEMGGERPLLDQAIDLLEDALGTLPGTWPRFTWAARELVEAYQRRAQLDDDHSNLDTAIAAGDRFLCQIPPEDQDRLRLHFALSTVYEDRGRVTGDAADFDHAIDHARASSGGEPDPLLQAHYGELLYQRAEAAQDVKSLDEAIERFAIAAANCPHDDPDWWLRQHDLARAHQLHWQLTQQASDLEAAMHHFDLSLTQPAPQADFTLLIHQQRTWAACQLLHHQVNRPHIEIPPAAGQLRRYLDEAHAALEDPALAGGDRAALDMTIAFGEFYVAGFQNDEVDVERIRPLVERAENAVDGDEWRDIVATLLGMLETAEHQLGVRPGTDGGVTDLARLASEQPSTGFSLARSVLPLAAFMRALRNGDRRGVRAAIDMMRLQGSPEDAESGLWTDLLEALDATWQDHRAEAARLCAKVQAGLDSMPPLYSAERPVRVVLGVLQTYLSTNTAYATQAPPPLPSGATLTGLELSEWLSIAMRRLTHAIAHGDLTEIRDCTERLAQVAQRPTMARQLWMMAVMLAGVGELEIARRDPADRAAAVRATHWYETLLAQELSDHPIWTHFNLNLAEALRLTAGGDRARTRRLGFAALRAHERMALLQSGTDHAIDSARAASADARKVAFWCLEDGEYEEAVAALDAGRGLAVRSATVSRKVADLLSRSGHHDLAAEWQASQGLGRDQLTGDPLLAVAPGMAGIAQVPDDLRVRVLRALDGLPAQDMLTPITTAQVRTALTAVGADALVYLIANENGSGLAVIVEAGGATKVLDLPRLSTGAGFTDLAATAGLVRDITAQRPARRPRYDLEPLCRWAWQAAMGPLIEHAARWALRRPARLVLIPMGSLALVPWHAACTVTGNARRYAVEELVLSYNVSAKLFCGTATHPCQPAGSALVVGDPQSNLPFAGAEAQAIHSRFYPFGRYLSGSHAAPEEVLTWLKNGPRAPSTLHFACHAAVDASRPAGAHLALHGGQLTARRLVEASQAGELVMNRVFLAACTTNVTGSDYDEAFSLATAFLAAGAHTVFGSLWAVADEDTSVLMFMLHHFLNAERLEPADALNQAQRWMLDPDRVPPSTMPPSLRRSAANSDCASPLSWAAFTHLGR